MKTDELITLLASDARSVSYRAGLGHALATLTLGILVAFVMMLVLLGPRPDLEQAAVLPMFWVKLAFPGALMLAAIGALVRLAYPGLQLGRLKIALALPFAAVWVMALLALAAASPEMRPTLIFGSTWARCSISIAALSVPTWIAAFWAVKQLAPTHLRATSAAAGLFAGASAAAVYALHCTEMQAPFLAVWYVLGILIPTVVGWLIGPKLLRW